MPSTENISNADELFVKIESYLNPEQVAYVRKAYDLASEAHKTQVRKSG